MFWPDRDYNPGMDILVAGCGTNQAAVIAFTNPKARVVAIDVSKPSLDHHKYLKDKYAMNNLSLHHLPIEEVGSLGRDFDLIISTGVLHHLADPNKGMSALSACLRQEGVIALMLYASYGRIGVEMMQSVFRELGLQQNDRSVLMVKDALQVLPDNHPVRSYISIAPDLQFDAGLVDTFLHGRDRSYNVRDCIDLVTSSGLVFQELFLKAPYYPNSGSRSAFLSSIAALPDQNQWTIMEKINFRNGCHFFTGCRPDRPTASYRIDFASEAALDYVPSFRYRVNLNGNTLFRQDLKIPLDPVQLALLKRIDGQHTIREIVALAVAGGDLSSQNSTSPEALGVEIFKSFWRLDALAMGLKPRA
jgi:SAM-dependent methyltransferase